MAKSKRDRPPESVKVGPIAYRIKCDTLTHTLAEHETRSDLMGCCNHKTLTIMVNPDIAPAQRRSTVVHEVLHALVNISGVGLSEPCDDPEERIVSALEAPLYALIRDNPNLIAWLTERECEVRHVEEGDDA